MLQCFSMGPHGMDRPGRRSEHFFCASCACPELGGSSLFTWELGKSTPQSRRAQQESGASQGMWHADICDTCNECMETHAASRALDSMLPCSFATTCLASALSLAPSAPSPPLPVQIFGPVQVLLKWSSIDEVRCRAYSLAEEERGTHASPQHTFVPTKHRALAAAAFSIEAYQAEAALPLPAPGQLCHISEPVAGGQSSYPPPRCAGHQALQ